ncbi:Longin-like domain and Adaptor protein complex, sigma subunit family and AP complex, mu/sigma subunit domain-containing protein [Strongyloides ratti]|uniref:AP complex subunit sigma n=1 Tax=Strongyloides ratti TaxID=34506 RepID=A0A090L306_STRRB|nr:Longin-like domain and Adaptor protein complex, sigma subunit family and AP complex, mu/sigma subunit domain-containing protein [Strongyloides ratti]CEF62497.1 Longin-like domain and Adaptor protein complex, sigma subunit family and AP complex, mu/sigma subunit domain-containing protein [Strongyloides ratti]
MFHFIIAINNEGKPLIQKWFEAYSEREKKMYLRDIWTTMATRNSLSCNILEYKDFKVVYGKYSTVYFVCAISKYDNELISIYIIDRLVRTLSHLIPKICELTLEENFRTVHHLIDEMFCAGELQETSLKLISDTVFNQDVLEFEEVKGTNIDDQDIRNIY